jgi:general secretion pathway protein K
VGNNRGMALLLTLWILAALIVLAAGLSVIARTETQISANYSDVVFCRWAARAGQNFAAAKVESLAKNPQTYLGEGGQKLSSIDEGIDIGDTSFEVAVDDEAGKVNINTASAQVLEAMFGSREVADCVIDWRDSDDQPQPTGAETQYYSGLQTPYKCKNAPFETVDEIKLVKGVTEEMLSTPVGENGRPLRDLLTVYSQDRNESTAGKTRLNIQTATQEQMKSGLGDVLTDQDIQAIIQQRGRKKFDTAGQVALTRGLSKNKVQNIYDQITVSDAKTLPGLINVNTAPVEVLATLPGMDRRVADAIVAQRASVGPYTDVGKILQVMSVTKQAFAGFADLLTVRSRVFKLTSTGKITRNQTSSRIVCIADMGDGQSAKIRYWQE